MDISSRANSSVYVQHVENLLSGDTEVISIDEPAAVRRERLIVSIDVEQ